jgi:DNA-binding transcriptional LysR family regulator
LDSVVQLSALRYFLETVRLGSIRRASETLHVAPSAISRQVALLEENFGAPLFERHANGVRLTPAGEIFARQARSTLRDLERLQSEIDDLQNLRRGLVRLCAVEWSLDVVNSAVEEFGRKYPGISYEVRVAGAVGAITALVNEECDIAISFEPDPHKDVVEVQAFRDPIVAIMHPAHPLASRARLKVRDLADQRVALLDGSHVTRLRLDQALASEGVAVHCVMDVTRVHHVIAIARKGLAMAFAPSEFARDGVKAGTLKTALIDHPGLLTTRYVLCRHKSRTPTVPAQAFLMALQRQFTALDAKSRKVRRRR